MSVERDRQGPTGAAVADHIVLALTRNRPPLTMSLAELRPKLPLATPTTIAQPARVLAGRDGPFGLRPWVASSGRDQYALRRDARDHHDRLAGR